MVEPKILASPVRTLAIASTPGAFAAASAAVVGIGSKLFWAVIAYAAVNSSSTALVKVEMIPWASTATKVTSASPIISAAAVEAVRCGLRRALSRASTPAAPPIFVAGQPRNAASGRTSCAANPATPRKISSVPMPIAASTGPVPLATKRPTSSAAKPSTVTASEPTARKRANRPGGSVAPSRTAAIGGTLVARSAGRRLASSVIRIPTRSETTIVLVWNASPLFGSVNPIRSKSLNSPFARKRPRNRPVTEASTPITSDSTITDHSTCLREAPSVRRVANSRIRCAIVIESELAITKAPTKRATPANASRNVCRKLMKLLTSEASSDACAVPLRTCVPGGRIERTEASSFTSGTSGFEAIRIASSLPCLPKRSCAVGRSKPASVAPPIVARSPVNLTMPEMWKIRTGPSDWIPIVSPTPKSFLSAVASSITTPPWPGHSPCTSSSELNRGCEGSTLKPMLGAPPKTIALPFLPIRCASPWTPPSAASTSGSSFTFGSSDSSNEGSWLPPLSPRSNADLPVIAASVPR